MEFSQGAWLIRRPELPQNISAIGPQALGTMHSAIIWAPWVRLTRLLRDYTPRASTGYPEGSYR